MVKKLFLLFIVACCVSCDSGEYYLTEAEEKQIDQAVKFVSENAHTIRTSPEKLGKVLSNRAVTNYVRQGDEFPLWQLMLPQHESLWHEFVDIELYGNEKALNKKERRRLAFLSTAYSEMVAPYNYYCLKSIYKQYVKPLSIDIQAIKSDSAFWSADWHVVTPLKEEYKIVKEILATTKDIPDDQIFSSDIFEAFEVLMECASQVTSYDYNAYERLVSSHWNDPEDVDLLMFSLDNNFETRLNKWYQPGGLKRKFPDTYEASIFYCTFEIRYELWQLFEKSPDPYALKRLSNTLKSYGTQRR